MAYLGNTPARSFISFEKQVFTIVNSQTAYTLSHSVNNENDIRLVINNIVQEPGSGKAYTASGTTLTLSAALTNGTDEMYCVFLGRATATNAPGSGSVGTSQLASDAVTEAKIADDAISDEHLDSTAITGQTAESTVADDDLILISDTSASAALKKMTKANFVSGAGESNLPYFYVTLDNNQTMSASTHTVLAFDSVEHDTASGFNTSNYRYTPNVAGKYYFEACLQFTYSGSLGNTTYQYIRKNATAVVEASNREGGYGSVTQTSGILTMNGSSDYVDIQVYGNPSGNFIAEGNGTNKRTYFMGFLLSAT